MLDLSKAMRLALVVPLVFCAYSAGQDGKESTTKPTPSATSQGKVELKAKRLPGTYTITNDSESVTKAVVENKEVTKKKVQTTVVVKMVITNVEGGKQNLSFKIEKSKTKISTPDGDTEFDSSAPTAEDAELAKALTSDIAFSALLDSDGNITQVTGIDNFRERLKGKGPSASGIENIYNDETILAMCKQARDFWPKMPVGIGDSFNTTVNLPSPVGNIDFRYDYTVKSIKGNLVVMDIKGKRLNDQKATTQENDGTIEIDTKMDQDGSVTFDTNLGEVTRYAINVAMEVVVASPDGKGTKRTAKYTSKTIKSTTYEAQK